MTDRKLLGLHAKIMSLRETLGISYKDASHRLYMAEWEKLKTDARTQKAFNLLTTRTKKTIEKLQTSLGQLGIAEKPIPDPNSSANADTLPNTP